MKFMTPSDAAKALSEYGVSYGQIKRGAIQGRIPYIKIGSHMMVDVDAAAAILAQECGDSALLNTEELSAATGLSVSAIRRGVSEGWLPTRGVRGRHLRFNLDDVKAVLERQMRENMDKAK